MLKLKASFTSGWNCMTHCQALRGSLDTSQASLHENNKKTYLYYSSSCQEPDGDTRIQLYQWTRCVKLTDVKTVGTIGYLLHL
jgi:hypothetical protein